MINTQSYRGELLILLSTILAGIGWIASKLVILEVPGETFVTARFLLASIILLPFCFKQVFALRFKQVLSLCTVGLVLAASIEVWVYAISISNTLSVGAFIMSLAMIIAPFISWLLYKISPPRIFWLTLPVTCIGIMLLTLTDGWIIETSQWFFLLSSVLLSLHFVLNKQVLNSVKPLTSICVQLFMIGSVGLIVMLIMSPESVHLNSHILFWFAVSTFVATCIRYLSQTLGSVDLCCLNFVRVKNVLIEANGLMPSNLSNSLFAKNHLTKSKTFLAEPFGQRLLAIFTALSTFYVE
ncbi:MAG: DMT family transporter [Shewanella sp.]